MKRITLLRDMNIAMSNLVGFDLSAKDRDRPMVYKRIVISMALLKHSNLEMSEMATVIGRDRSLLYHHEKRHLEMFKGTFCVEEYQDAFYTYHDRAVTIIDQFERHLKSTKWINIKEEITKKLQSSSNPPLDKCAKSMMPRSIKWRKSAENVM